jgi:hypothetical protein
MYLDIVYIKVYSKNVVPRRMEGVFIFIRMGVLLYPYSVVALRLKTSQFFALFVKERCFDNPLHLIHFDFFIYLIQFLLNHSSRALCPWKCFCILYI